MSQIVIVSTTGCKVKDWVSAASRLPLLYRLECLTSLSLFHCWPSCWSLYTATAGCYGCI